MNSRPYRQIALLSLFSFIALFPHLYRIGKNIVTLTYASGTYRFWHGISPYIPPPPGTGDWFKNSPLFALLYSPYTWLPNSGEALMWGLTNIIIYWWGISCWFTLRKKASPWIYLAWIAASMELDGSVRYQQTNALLIGLTLIGLALARDQKWRGSGFIIALAADIKVLPVFFLIPFLRKKEFIVGIIAAGAIGLLAPAVFVGPLWTLQLHLDWARILLRDIHSPGLLDIETVLAHLGISTTIAHASRMIVLLFGLMALPTYSRFEANRGLLGVWISFIVYTLLLVSPRTESPTFVLAGPTFLFLVDFILNTRRYRAAQRAVWCLGFFLISLSFNDIWPRRIWNPHDLHYATKTLGVWLLWFFSAAVLIAKWRSDKAPSRSQNQIPR